MTLPELIQEVYSLTGRPDRVSETASAIQAATLKAHQIDYFPKDIFEVGLRFTEPAFVQQLEYRTLIPRWRAFKYLRKYDNDVNVGIGGEDPIRDLIDLVVPENVFDSYSTTKTNICYLAGAFLQIYSSTAEQTYLLGCYVNPDITALNYDSWIALDHPYAIVFDAAATVFKAIGKDEEAAAYKKLVEEQLQMIQTSNVTAGGF